MFHNLFGGGRGKGDFKSALLCTPPKRFLICGQCTHGTGRFHGLHLMLRSTIAFYTFILHGGSKPLKCLKPSYYLKKN